MADARNRPFLIAKEADGLYRLSVRTTRYNSQGYPLVDVERVAQDFPTATAARNYARDTYNAKPGEYASK